MAERLVTIALPADVPNDLYARVTHGVQAVLAVAGLGDRSSIRPDALISDGELNDAFDKMSEHNPWAP